MYGTYARCGIVLLLIVSGLSLGQTDPNQLAIESMYKSRLEGFQSAPTPRAMADAYVEDITDDAVWMPQNAPPVRGKAAVHAWAEEFFGRYLLEIDSQEVEPLQIGERLAIRSFVSTGVYIERESSRRIPFDQKYIDVLKKQPDGSWKLASHMWSSNNKEASIWR